MPPPSRFNSLRAQNAAVAGLMALVFAAAMGGAWALTASRPAPPRSAHASRSVSAQGLRIALPSGWIAHDGRAADLAKRVGARHVAGYADPAHPDRELFVLRARMKVTPDQAIAQAIMVMIPPEMRKSLFHVTPRPDSPPLHKLIGRRYIGVSRAGPEDPTDQFFIAVLTRDGYNYWIVMLTHRDRSGEDLRESIDANRKMFNKILYSAEIPGADAG